jgi:hypothetical protein
VLDAAGEVDAAAVVGAATVVAVVADGAAVVVDDASSDPQPDAATIVAAHTVAISQRCFMDHPPGSGGQAWAGWKPPRTALASRVFGCAHGQATGLVVAHHEPPLRVSAGISPDFAAIVLPPPGRAATGTGYCPP